jgi:hypothetical protein
LIDFESVSLVLKETDSPTLKIMVLKTSKRRVVVNSKV